MTEEQKKEKKEIIPSKDKEPAPMPEDDMGRIPQPVEAGPGQGEPIPPGTRCERMKKGKQCTRSYGHAGPHNYTESAEDGVHSAGPEVPPPCLFFKGPDGCTKTEGKKCVGVDQCKEYVSALPEVPPEVQHRSDCAIYNEPAEAAGPCDCGAKLPEDEPPAREQPAQQVQESVLCIECYQPLKTAKQIGQPVTMLTCLNPVCYRRGLVTLISITKSEVEKMLQQQPEDPKPEA